MRYFLCASIFYVYKSDRYCYVYQSDRYFQCSMCISQIGSFYMHHSDRYFLCASVR